MSTNLSLDNWYRLLDRVMEEGSWPPPSWPWKRQPFDPSREAAYPPPLNVSDDRAWLLWEANR